MKTIGGKINLASLQHVARKMKGQDGEIDVIIIPIEKNNLFKSKKGNVYMDIIAFEIENKQYDDTHLVKQSLPKDVRAKMSDDEKKNQPILGNLNVNLSSGESEPQSAAPPSTNINEAEADLPF